MDEQMDLCEKVCAFEDTLDVDFDYEFDVAKFFDFTRPETAKEIRESEEWFHFAQGYPPSPLLVKLGLVVDDQGGSATSSPKSDHQSESGSSQISDADIVKQKSKAAIRLGLSKSSRLLQPTASQLAKQNQQKGACSIKASGRAQKPVSPTTSSGDDTKRQKLDDGYLRKIAHLKHQTSFGHKLPKKVASSSVNSPARPKVTTSKEPRLETANRAQRSRPKTPPELSRNSAFRARSSSKQSLAPELQRSKSFGVKAVTQRATVDLKRASSMKTLKNGNAEQTYRFQVRSPTKKVTSSRGDTAVSRNSKKEEPMLSDNKKQLQNPPIELFAKLSLKSEIQSNSLPEEGQCFGTKIVKKTAVSCSMKENKNANTIARKPARCCLKQSHLSGGRMTTLTSVI